MVGHIPDLSDDELERLYETAALATCTVPVLNSQLQELVGDDERGRARAEYVERARTTIAHIVTADAKFRESVICQIMATLAAQRDRLVAEDELRRRKLRP